MLNSTLVNMFPELQPSYSSNLEGTLYLTVPDAYIDT